MANELEKQEKKKAAEKKANERRSMKAAMAKKKKRTPVQYFKDAKSEFKKVVWPTRKQVFNNTVVVLTTIVVSGVAVWGLDCLFKAVWFLVLGK